MANKKVNKKDEDQKIIGVNTPERDDDFENDEDFFSEETSEGSDVDDSGEGSSDDSEDTKAGNAKEKKGFFKSICGVFGAVKKHWKLTLGITGVAIVGGVVFLYVVGKKQPVKLGKVDDVVDALTSGEGNTADVIDFAKALEEQAKDMKENPENHKVTNF